MSQATQGGDSANHAVEALRTSSQHLRRVVEGFDPSQLDTPSYCSEWRIADVLSHLGSGAVILQQRLEDTLTGNETPQQFSQAVWDEWNAKGPAAAASDALVADRELMSRYASLSPEQRDDFRFVMGPITADFTGFVCLRLNEHVLHTWDIEVMTEPTSTLEPTAIGAVVDRLELVARFTGTASDVERHLSVRTTEPTRNFALALGPEGVTLSPSTPNSRPDLELPAEAFVRLIYGRLDPDHTPALRGTAYVNELRRVFPGP